MTHAEIMAELTCLLDDHFPDHEGGYQMEMGPDDVAGWDSFAQVSLIPDLEERFGVRFEPADLVRLSSIGAIVETIARLKQRHV